MKPKFIISITIIILIIGTVIGLSIYYDAQKKLIPTSPPTSIPELLGFKAKTPTQTPTQTPTNLQMDTVGYIGIGIAGIFLVTVILYGLFIFLPNWGQIY
jgi:hypothetical protein